MRVMAYPIGAAAKQYAADVKPVLVAVAKRLGYTVGTYSGHGNPSVTLRSTDAQSPVECVVLYFRGYELEAGVRSRAWRATMQTEIGRIAHAMSFGVHEAYGRSAHADLASRIEQAITNAVHAYSAGDQRAAALKAGSVALAELQRTPDVLAYYTAHADGRCDFVWIEETVDVAMVKAGYGGDRAAYCAACKVVFDWLLAAHGVQPPTWFKREAR